MSTAQSPGSRRSRVKSRNYTSDGMDYVVEDPATVTLAGDDYVRMDSSVTTSGVTVYQTYLFRWVSGYMLTISITAQSAEDCEALTACVQPLAA